MPRPLEKEIVADRRERVAGNGSELHGAGCFFGEARGSASKSGRHNHAEAGGRRNHGEKSDVAGHSTAAAAQAKAIDRKAENERRKLLAEKDRIRVTSAADAERLSSEAAILKQNPLLLNKIVAERLSDKLQIMMVPGDGKFFFANDVLRSMSVANQAGQAEQQLR